MSSSPQVCNITPWFWASLHGEAATPAASKSMRAHRGWLKGSDESKEPVTSLVNHHPDLQMIGVCGHVHVPPPPTPQPPVYPFSGLQNGPGA